MNVAHTATPARDAGPAAHPLPWAERPLLMACEGERLLGILHPAAGDTGVVFVVGGPQYRAGSHRHFVKLARTMAAAGHPVLRFDVRGMGDSSGPLHGFDQLSPDIGVAIDTLIAQQPQVHRVVLWGLCDGASAALLYLHDRPDARVAGLCLLNPWVRSTQSLARTQVKHYYRQRLMQRDFWAKLVSGRVAISALRDLRRALRQAWGTDGAVPITPSPPGNSAPPATFQARMAAAWMGYSGRIVLVLSGNDYTAKEFLELTSSSPEWSSAFMANTPDRIDIEDADHTFSQPGACAASVAAALSLAARIQLDCTNRKAPRDGPG